MKAPDEPVERTLRPSAPIDLGLTLGSLRHGGSDPTIRFEPGRVWRATRTPLGPATIALSDGGVTIRVTAWGAGAEWAVEHAPELVGLHDEPARLIAVHPLVRDLARRMPGLRLGRSRAVVESLIPAICEQKVTGAEASRAFRRLVWAYGEPAPGPARLMVPPAPERLARLPYHAFHPLGLERRRAETIRRVAAQAGELERTVDLPLTHATRRISAIPGVGPWTTAEVALRALGDEDAVSVGDFHLPNLVAWALAGEPRGDDARMLELLEPYRGQRARVIRLLEASGIRAPRHGPRLAPRSIAAI